MEIICLQHVPFEGPGYIQTWAETAGHKLRTFPLYQDIVFPSPQDLDLLLVMGGPMNVDEDYYYPFLTQEKAFIRQVIFEGKSVLGICLGAQLIARALGAEVGPGTKEIGWMPVWRSAEAADHPLLGCLPHEFYPLHWHGDAFTVPEEGLLGATSQGGTISQAFAVGDSVLGLQFHLEATPHTVKGLLENAGHELSGPGHIQEPAQIREGLKTYQQANHAILEKLLAQMTA